MNTGNYGKRQVRSVAVLPIENIDCTWEKIDIHPIIKLILWSCNELFNVLPYYTDKMKIDRVLRTFCSVVFKEIDQAVLLPTALESLK